VTLHDDGDVVKNLSDENEEDAHGRILEEIINRARVE
jgi:hypothetical protein